MKIIHIKIDERVEKTKEELEQQENNIDRGLLFADKYKIVPLKEPIYIVEMSMEELQLVSFYLELEKRKPTVNIELETILKQGE